MILEGKIGAERVYGNNGAVAFLDINPRSPGHTLVIPKVHAPTILEVSKESSESLFEAICEVEKRITKTLNPQGFTVGLNQGEVAGQEVEHLHFHIIPRFTGDGGVSIQAVVDNIPSESIKTLGEKIREE